MHCNIVCILGLIVVRVDVQLGTSGGTFTLLDDVPP
jgi:hypothetical protein